MIKLTEETSKNEETTTETTEEESPVEEKPQCLVLTDKQKSWIECCTEFDAGKIDDAGFMARIKNIKEPKENEPTEESEVKE